MYIYLYTYCVCVYKQQPVLKTVGPVAKKKPLCAPGILTPKFPRPGRAEVPLGHVGLPFPAPDPPVPPAQGISSLFEILLCQGKKSFILHIFAQPKRLIFNGFLC